jgi:hypothetical protein
VPRFAEGEAVALVEAEIVLTEDSRNSTASAYFCTRRTLLNDVLYATTTASSYLGQGVWAVSSELFETKIYGDTSFEWKVYEFSGVVQPTNWITTHSMRC